MDTYSIFRQIADSWVLLMMFCFFGGVILWAFRPGSKQVHREAADLVFRNDKIAPEGVDTPAKEEAS